MSDRQPPPTVQVNVFNFETIRATLEGLLWNLERDLHRRALGSNDRPTAKGFVLMRIAVLYVKTALNAIRFLCADQNMPGRHPEHVLVIPSISRTMLEALFTVMYLSEEFPRRCESYQKAGWREQVEEMHKYKTEYSAKKEWQPFFHNFDEVLAVGAKHFEITEGEWKDPRTIKYWMSGHQLIERMGPQNRAFAKWLDKWFYHEISAIAHFDPFGLTKIAIFLLKEQATETEQERIDADFLPRFRAFYISIAIIVVTAIASELEHSFRLNNRKQILELWENLRASIPDAEEICRKRYDGLLSNI